MREMTKFLLTVLLGVMAVMLLLFALPAMAKKKESIPVYIDTPPHRKPYVSTADKNRLYSLKNPIRRVDPEVKKYLEKLNSEKEEK